MADTTHLTERRVKIVCTIGPATNNEEGIRSLIQSGMNVARLNFSHGSEKDHTKSVELIRKISEELNSPVAILQDLQGPKIRVGDVSKKGIDLVDGDEVLLLSTSIYESEEKQKKTKKASKIRIPVSYETLGEDLNPCDPILLDDGKIKLETIKALAEGVLCRVIQGGNLTSRKGVNFPSSSLSVQGFTEKDRSDLIFGLKLGVDFVAISFVREPQDVKVVKQLIHSHRLQVPVIAKIEKPEAIKNLDGILEVADGLMVARGDMAVEIGNHKVPPVQKKIIQKCNEVGKPVITATQMLESMIESPTPTRAEASDIANAVYDGTDAVMLSAETATGKYPAIAVFTMSEIVYEAEKEYLERLRVSNWRRQKRFKEDPIERSAVETAVSIGAQGIACVTMTGTAARKISKYRPEMPIWALTDQKKILRRLSLYWGVRGVYLDEILGAEDFFDFIEQKIVDHGAVKRGDFIVITTGIPILTRGTTNTLKIHPVTKLPTGVKEVPKDEVQLVKSEVFKSKTMTTFILDQEICIGCRGCVDICPFGIFEQIKGKAYLVENQCVNCTDDNSCVEICPTNAVDIVKTF